MDLLNNGSFATRRTVTAKEALLDVARCYRKDASDAHSAGLTAYAGLMEERAKTLEAKAESLPTTSTEPTNKEGLTFREWLNAAGITSHSTRVLRAAWEAGEDPTEHRAQR